MPLIRLFLDICLLRKGPQDTPASQLLFWIALMAYVLVGAMQAVLVNVRQWEGLIEIPLQAGILWGFAWISLMAAGKTNRLQQTLIALLGADALLSSFSIPLEWWLLVEPQEALANLSLLLLMLWHMLVIAHILRHSLSQTWVVGLGLSLVYIVFTVQVMVVLFGPPTTLG